MNDSPNLDPETEAVFVQLLRHLEWQPSGFSLIFLFADVGPALQLASWLDARLVLLGQPLQRLEASKDFVAEPEAEVDALIARLPALSEHAGAVWYALHRHPADARWNAARSRFLSRINERRFLLERDLDRPLILLLPSSSRAEVAAMTPDLWHIRSSSLLLRADMPPRSEYFLEQASSKPPARIQDTQTSLSAYEEWRRILQAQDGRQVFLPLSQTAIDALLDAGRPADAAEVAQQAQRIALERSLSGTPEALRDLSVSLNQLGRVAQVQGDWEQAEAVYRESLDLSRQLLERLGGTPEVLRDLSVSLDNLGRVAQAQGDWAQAEAVYRESLDLRRQLLSRQLLKRLDNIPEALRDLSVSLNNLGGVAQAQGDWAQAEILYRESLDLRRQLVEHFGGTPEALRDLSVSLDNLGRVARAQGNWALAEAVYRESLDLRRQLVERLGGTPEALRDLSVSLNNRGRVAQAQGDWAQAEALYRESLDLNRQLLDHLGGAPKALRDLSVSLDNLGWVAQEQGDWAQAEALYRESLSLRRQLLERLGGTPEALDDLAFSLWNLSSLPAGDPAALAEAAGIYRTLATRFPTVKRYRNLLHAIEGQMASPETPVEPPTP